ncbi:S-layer homology domain-containing protein [Paenibacillus sp. BIC5C1]|uniref:S-layer homology domain-containing protein n=1 Tax=Paenibacillus sp. BIC5C1 TaxID=3078263 RepID=UPI0028E7D7B3|nr:S-layer homology domain-containing protein [Paenibacillus sp. BIC5C1]
MYYKKLISCLLAVVLILQVVSVGGVASAGPAPTLFQQLNMERESYIESDAEVTMANVQNLLEQQNLFPLPEDYVAFNDIQKYEIARGMVMLLPLEFSYENDNQIKYVFDLVYQLIKLPKQIETSTLQENITLVYSLLAEWYTYFPNVGKTEWVQAGNDYTSLTGADLKMFVSDILFYNITFKDFSFPTYFNSQLEFMVSKISGYREINKAIDTLSMGESLDKLYEIYGFIQPHIDFKQNPDIQPFVFDMEKMSTIENDTTKKSELAQWMIDHKPQNGYETVSEVQAAFDAFFEPDSEALLSQLNDYKKRNQQGENANFIPAVLELLRHKQLVAEPDFNMLSEDDQFDIAVYMLLYASPPTSDGFENKEQVQYLVQLALQTLELPRKIGGADSREILDEFFNKQDQRIQYFNDMEANDPYYEHIRFYFNSSAVERRMTAFIYERKLTRNLKISDILDYTESALDDTPYINKVETSEDMLEVLQKMFDIQSDIESYNSNDPETPLGSFPLNISKWNNLTPEEQEQLADHMLTERPTNGYASFESIQTTFNEFFPGNEIDALAAVNAAKSSNDIDGMILAVENPDLEINLPNGYYESLQVKKFIAGFLIDYVKNDYRNKDQVQYMIELAVLAQSIWGQKEFDVLKNKLDLFAQKLVDGPDYFNDQQTYVLRSLGQQHLDRSQVDKGVFAYKYLHQVAFERLEGEFKGNIVNPEIVLSLFSMHLESFENATSIPLMDEWLDHAMNEWIAGEAFFDNYKFRRTGALDLSKRAELSTEGRKELAEWVLNEQDRYEDVGNLQYVFNRFFTAPNVTGNDITNTITGLNDTMEISLNGKQTWIDVASIQKFDFSGDKTVWVRYKAISDLLPGRAVKIVFTANGDSNNGNGSTNPGSSTGDGSSVTTPATTTPTTKQEQIVVDVNGANGTNLTKTPITRTTEADGTIKDLVKMSEAIAKESVEKAKQLNMNTARIVIPDAKDAVSETRIELPKAAVKQLNDGGLNLEISTENAIISVPTKSIAGFDQDLYFRVVPLKKESERKDVEERAKKERLIQQITPNSNVKVLARPVEIETNMQSHEVTLTLPLRDSLPTDPAARQQALDNLAVYIEHSDGTKELIQGKLVSLSDSSEGIEFTVNKFSTFTLVVVDGLKASKGSHNPYINGFGADFRPDAFVTRAQMAAMLARNLSDDAGTASANVVNYADVSATHWAASDIEKAQSAGIMNGMNATQFAPEGSITRAQMATIAYRWMQQQSADATSSTSQATDGAGFTDVSANLWASDAIAYVQSAGLMTGYNDGTFKPDSKLTRAEAVKVLNVLFKRTPVTGVTTPSFTDVPATHWAYADIEAAAQK